MELDKKEAEAAEPQIQLVTRNHFPGRVVAQRKSDEKINYKSKGPGVDFMITIFCNFCQFSAKKLEFFSKTNVMIQFLHNLALF
jgi:hypothetical protein